ncbi:Methyl-accepting chemotaxis protein [Grimontia indica]|uniref:Methyl-accepting chemotaxis protein n=1 Tax=Grimontia indica TaxID=1056512 RepID=R1GUI5_9GAMM|nr:methyl-accepting chemotaxis protein [Grimontia indica]EOD79838.1 Methyl-accepting chemotaxis protein [Grimontia indica]
MKSIKLKISTFTGIATLAAISVMTAFSLYFSTQLQTHSNQRNQTLLLEMFNNGLQAELSSAAEMIAGELSDSFIQTSLMAENFSRQQKASDQDTRDTLRASLNHQLKGLLESNPNALGVFTAWEPNALDSMDSLYASQTGHDRSGRFIPYWNRDAAGRFQLEPLAGYADETRTDGGARVGEYYLCSRDSRRNCLLDPYVYPVNGQNVLLTSVVSPVMVDGQFAGITGLDISLAALSHVAESLSQRLYQGQSHVMLVTDRGTIAADSEDRSLGDSVKSLGGDANLWANRLGRDGYQSFTSADDQRITAMIPVKANADIAPWTLVVTLDKALVIKNVIALQQQALEDQREQTLISLLMGVVVLLANIALIWVIAGRIAAPIRSTSEFMLQVADGDFTRRLGTEADAPDETGELARACNTFLDQTQAVIKQVTATSHTVSDNAVQSSAVSQQTLEGVSRQMQMVNQVATAATEMSTTAQTVAQHAESAANAATSTQNAAARGQQMLNEVQQAIEKLESEVSEASNVITRLGENSQNVHGIIDVIKGIADQTNLLALNAAIEAARAGEYGRGFAVVADEVRSLSLRTQSSTQQIYDLINQLQVDAESAVEVMDAGSQSAQACVELANDAAAQLTQMTDEVDNISMLNTEVASIAMQQSMVSEQVSQDLVEISQVVTELSSAASQSQSSSQQLKETAESLDKMVSHFTV